MSGYDDWKCTEPADKPAPEPELPDVADVAEVSNTREADFIETNYEKHLRRMGL